MYCLLLLILNYIYIVYVVLIKKPPAFNWGPGTIAALDSSFFWGYLVTQVPGGYLAAKFPANRVFGIALAISAFLNCLLPSAAKMSVLVAMLVRILQGLVEVIYYFILIFLFYILLFFCLNFSFSLIYV
jgi:hypothetical protein